MAALLSALATPLSSFAGPRPSPAEEAKLRYDLYFWANRPYDVDSEAFDKNFPKGFTREQAKAAWEKALKMDLATLAKTAEANRAKLHDGTLIAGTPEWLLGAFAQSLLHSAVQDWQSANRYADGQGKPRPPADPILVAEAEREIREWKFEGREMYYTPTGKNGGEWGKAPAKPEPKPPVVVVEAPKEEPKRIPLPVVEAPRTDIAPPPEAITDIPTSGDPDFAGKTDDQIHKFLNATTSSLADPVIWGRMSEDDRKRSLEHRQKLMRESAYRASLVLAKKANEDFPDGVVPKEIEKQFPEWVDKAIKNRNWQEGFPIELGDGWTAQVLSPGLKSPKFLVLQGKVEPGKKEGKIIIVQLEAKPKVLRLDWKGNEDLNLKGGVDILVAKGNFNVTSGGVDAEASAAIIGGDFTAGPLTVKGYAGGIGIKLKVADGKVGIGGIAGVGGAVEIDFGWMLMAIQEEGRRRNPYSKWEEAAYGSRWHPHPNSGGRGHIYVPGPGWVIPAKSKEEAEQKLKLQLQRRPTGIPIGMAPGVAPALGLALNGVPASTATGWSGDINATTATSALALNEGAEVTRTTERHREIRGL